MLVTLLKFLSYLTDIEQGPLNKSLYKPIKLNQLINTFKFGTFFFILSLMIIFKNYSYGAFTYLSLHGTYGFIWILKDYFYPDKGFQGKISILYAFFASLFLIIYYTCGILIIINIGENNPSPKHIFFCFFIFAIGVLFLISADVQKYVILAYKKGLISNGILKNNRNTNFLGEAMIYFSFTLCCNRLVGYIIIFINFFILVAPRMYNKEESLKRKEGYTEYKKDSYFMLFKIYDNEKKNLIFYGVILIIMLFIYLL